MYCIVYRADLQTATQRINLVPGAITETSVHTREALSPGSTIDQVTISSWGEHDDHYRDQVISHEVKELGTHILVCEVTYHSAAGEKLNFRKFFKFQVRRFNPLLYWQFSRIS